jgi:hypothetical protein
LLENLLQQRFANQPRPDQIQVEYRGFGLEKDVMQGIEGLGEVIFIDNHGDVDLR